MAEVQQPVALLKVALLMFELSVYKLDVKPVDAIAPSFFRHHFTTFAVPEVAA